LRQTLRFPNFDAELNTDRCGPLINAELTLTLRLGLQKVHPGSEIGNYPDANNQTHNIIRWTPEAWTTWKDRFRSIVQTFWDGKFWLVNDCFSFPFQSGETTLYPNIWCRFILILNDNLTSDNHHTVQVVRLDPKAGFFRSNAGLYTDRDTEPFRTGDTSKGKPIFQIPGPHEIAHVLGLDHVAVGKPGCPASGDQGAPACYGISDYDMQSVMGRGMELRPEHAYPWRESLRYFALEELMKRVMKAPFRSKYNALMTAINSPLSPWPTRMRNCYPRTFLGVETGREFV